MSCTFADIIYPFYTSKLKTLKGKIHELTVVLIIIIRYIYIAFLGSQTALHTVWKGGNLLNHHQCAASTWMMRWQPYCARMPTTSLLEERRQSDDGN